MEIWNLVFSYHKKLLNLADWKEAELQQDKEYTVPIRRKSNGVVMMLVVPSKLYEIVSKHKQNVKVVKRNHLSGRCQRARTEYWTQIVSTIEIYSKPMKEKRAETEVGVTEWNWIHM